MRAAQGARLVTGQRRGELHEFLQSRLAPEAGIAAADALLGSTPRPST